MKVSFQTNKTKWVERVIHLLRKIQPEIYHVVLSLVDTAHGTILHGTGLNQEVTSNNYDISALYEAKAFMSIYWTYWSIWCVIGHKFTQIFKFYSLLIIVVIWNFSYARVQSSRLSISQHTYRPIYSPANKQPHLWHVKHHKCHCFSNASNACPLRISFPQPAQSTSIEKI